MPRGGNRRGTPGGLYPNRSDMRTPIAAAPGQPYGEAGAQLAAQHTVPMGAPPAAAPTAPAGGAASQPGILPGQLPAFNRPSDQPAVHVMSGAPTGPGPGVEALGLGGPGSQQLSQIIQQAAVTAGSQELAALAQAARNHGQ